MADAEQTRLGRYITSTVSGEALRAYIPPLLPPDPPLRLEGLQHLLEQAIGRLDVCA